MKDVIQKMYDFDPCLLGVLAYQEGINVRSVVITESCAKKQVPNKK